MFKNDIEFFGEKLSFSNFAVMRFKAFFAAQSHFGEVKPFQNHFKATSFLKPFLGGFYGLSFDFPKLNGILKTKNEKKNFFERKRRNKKIQKNLVF